MSIPSPRRPRRRASKPQASISRPARAPRGDDEGSPVTWGEHVTDDEYSAAPAS